MTMLNKKMSNFIRYKNIFLLTNNDKFKKDQKLF